MKHWQELVRIVDRVTALGASSESATVRLALAVVVGIQGSAYRRPGAKLLIEADGKISGGVSGGCIEADVRQVGLQVLHSGRSRLVHYDTREGDQPWGLGLGCDGEIEVLVAPLEPSADWNTLRQALRADAPIAFAAAVDDEARGRWFCSGPGGAISGEVTPAIQRAAAQALAEHGGLEAEERPGGARLMTIEGERAFIEVLRPPPRLVVCGAGDDARPLVALAANAGFQVDVVDHRPAYLTSERFPEAAHLIMLRSEAGSLRLPTQVESYVVVMTHALSRDKHWVQQLLIQNPRYLGVLGPRRRIAKIVGELGVASDKIYGPVGLDLGADGAEQVAISIVAELLAVRAGREARHLRDRAGSLHAG